MKSARFIVSLPLLLAFAVTIAAAQNRPIQTAYSAISAGIGSLWLTQEQGIFKKHGLDSNLIYIRGGTTAVQALLAGEIQFGHLSPAPMLAAWAQGADFVWVGTTTHQMVFTLITDSTIIKGSDLKGKKIGITRIGSASDLALRAALENFGLGPKDVTMISIGRCSALATSKEVTTPPRGRPRTIVFLASLNLLRCLASFLPASWRSMKIIAVDIDYYFIILFLSRA